jgi:hypothetical protein
VLAALLAGVVAAAAPAPCHASDLTLASAGSQGAAGTEAEQLRLVPKRGVTCEMGGYPGIELIGPGGAKLGIHVGRLRDDLHPVRTLTFSHRHPARFDIRHPGASQPAGTPCRHRVVAVRVLPPNETAFLAASLPCPGPRFCVNGARVTPVGRRY